jgi:hypothetical protein
LTLLDQLSLSISIYFALDSLKSKVPEEFWQESRVTLRPFKDFLSVYKYWQEITKPMWAESYGKDLSLPVKPEVTRIERGDSEEPVQYQPVQPLEGWNWVVFFSSAIIMFTWCRMWEWSQIPEFLVLEEGPKDGIAPVIASISRSYLVVENNGLEVYGNPNYFALGLLALGATLLLGTVVVSIYKGQFYDLSWFFITRDNPEILITPPPVPALQLDTVMVGSMRISGPISSHSLDLVKFHLENRALLENLDISPISALWELPIGW